MSLARQRVSPQEYLAIEREAEYKSEYFQGTMYAMAGANEPHNLISTNITAELRTQFKGRPCRVYASDMRVKVSATGLYTYPDVLALCGQALFEDEKRDTLLNPSLIIEILSASTESYVRGEKFAQYRNVQAITDYVLVAQDRPRVEHFTRQPKGRWLLSAFCDLQDTLSLENLNCQLPLLEIYDKIEFSTGRAGLRDLP